MRSETARRIEKMTGKSFGWLDLANTPNTNGERSTIKTEATKYLSTEEEKLIRGIFEDARNQVIDLLIKSRKKSSKPEHPRDPRLDPPLKEAPHQDDNQPSNQSRAKEQVQSL
jgi:hypothetical protein